MTPAVSCNQQVTIGSNRQEFFLILKLATVLASIEASPTVMAAAAAAAAATASAAAAAATA